MRDGVPNEEMLTKDLSKLDISTTSEHPIVDIREDEVIFDGENLVGNDRDTEKSYLCPGADISRRHGAETAPAYGLLSDEESSLKRYFKILAKQASCKLKKHGLYKLYKLLHKYLLIACLQHSTSFMNNFQMTMLSCKDL